MTIACVASLRSKDPNTKVGAVIVDCLNHIVGTGYNGFVKGIDETKVPLTREGKWIDSKYPYIVHAEINALLNTTVLSLKDTRLYCTLFPCNECAKAIAQSGIKEIIYLSNKHKTDDIFVASQKILELSSIKYRKLEKFDLNMIKDMLVKL